MAFSPEVAERLLVACHRHCCICHKPTGSKIEIHHIVPKVEGGDDSEKNGIPLCFDCHAEVAAYNPKHPKGRRFTPSELRKHKEQWFAIAARPQWERAASLRVGAPARVASVEQLMDDVRKLELWNPDVSRDFLPSVLQLNGEERVSLVEGLAGLLQDESEEVRWHVAIVVEFLVEWDPGNVPAELLVAMSNDPFFSVRSSAAVSYYHLAATSPDAVPVEVLGRLAAYDEDWYVTTPATSAMLRLARTRSVAIDVLARGLDHPDPEAQRHAADVFARLAKVDPAALRSDVGERMLESSDVSAREVGRTWHAIIEQRRKSGEGLDFYIF